jgi:hypothetical protein
MRISKLAITILIGICALFAGAAPASRGNPSPASPLFVPCPTHLIAPYGGMDGWSTINVQANFARALMAPGRKMTCQYRFGSGAPFFGIQKPCPVGSTCIVRRNGFLITP